MKTTITPALLRTAFNQFVLRLREQSAMTDEQWAECLAAMNTSFDDYCTRDHADLFASSRFLQLRSRTSYVGYAGPQASVVELATDASDEALGAAVLQMLDASRQMMLDYLEGRLHPLERDEGESYHAAQMDQLCARYGFRNRSALMKGSRSVTITRDLGRDLLAFAPSRRVRSNYFSGIGPEATVELPGNAGPEAVGKALRLAMERCR